MNNLEMDSRILLIRTVKKTISEMVESYLNDDDVDLDMKELEILKKTYDSLCYDRPLDNESRVYLKTLAGDELGDGLNVLRDKVDDNPKLRSDVDELIIWYHIAKEVC